MVHRNYAVRATRIARAPASASRPIRPTSGSSLAVLGRLPEVPTGRCSLSVAEGGGTLGAAGDAVGGALWAGVCSGVAVGCAGDVAGCAGDVAGCCAVIAGCSGVVLACDGVLGCRGSACCSDALELDCDDADDCESAPVTRDTVPLFQSSIVLPSLSTDITPSPDACAICIACDFG